MQSYWLHAHEANLRSFFFYHLHLTNGRTQALQSAQDYEVEIGKKYFNMSQLSALPSTSPQGPVPKQNRILPASSTVLTRPLLFTCGKLLNLSELYLHLPRGGSVGKNLTGS